MNRDIFELGGTSGHLAQFAGLTAQRRALAKVNIGHQCTQEDSAQWLATPVRDSHGGTTCHTSLSSWDCRRLLRAGREAQVSGLR